MDDRFLEQMRRDPDPRFSRELRERLREDEAPRRFPSLRPVPAFAGALAVALIVSLFAFPSVRVSAQALLDMFRVRNFTAVSFDAARLEKLRALDTNDALMVFDHEDNDRAPDAPVLHTSVESAGAAAGFQVLRAVHPPLGLTGDSVFVSPAAQERLTVNESRVRALLDALEIRDVSVPAGIDGQVVEVRTSPVVVQLFRHGRLSARVIQARSPEMSAPAGFEVERLAEIGLRVLGLDAGEARRVAQSTDWRTTLLIPVPATASAFRHVTVRGQRGLLVTTTAAPSPDGHRRRGETVLMWTEGERVFGVVGNLGEDDALQLAESLR